MKQFRSKLKIWIFHFNKPSRASDLSVNFFVRGFSTSNPFGKTNLDVSDHLEFSNKLDSKHDLNKLAEKGLIAHCKENDFIAQRGETILPIQADRSALNLARENRKRSAFFERASFVSSQPAVPKDLKLDKFSTNGVFQKRLELLKKQPRLWIEIYIYQQRFLVTEGDVVTIPVNLKQVDVGDIIKLDKAAKIGSRDFTIKGRPLLESKLYECEAVVIEKTTSSLIEFFKHRRRRRHVRRVRQKQPYTRIRICKLNVNDVDAIENDSTLKNK